MARKVKIAARKIQQKRARTLPTFFRNFVTVDVPDTTRPVNRPPDVSGECLPFLHLEDRRFEILTYLLKKDLHPRHHVTLMQGVGEQGRDVVRYTERRKLEEISQCKLLKARISHPEVCRELLKLALHSYIDPQILSRGIVRYELWCPGDFSQPAAKLIDEWPTGWNEKELKASFAALKADYVAFEELSWVNVQKWVLRQFPQKLDPHKITGIDITGMVKANPKIYQNFFTGQLVMREDDVSKKLEELVKKGNLRQLSDDDVRHIVDRIETFDPSLRLYLGGYLLGIRPEVIAFMTNEEIGELGILSSAAYKTVSLLMNVLIRYSFHILNSAKGELKLATLGTLYVLRAFLRMKVLLTLDFPVIAGFPFVLPSKIDAYRNKPDAVILKMICDRAWDDFHSVLQTNAEAVPDFALLELNQKAAQAYIGEFKSKEQYDAALSADLENNRDVVRKLTRAVMELTPNQLMMISDTQSPFGKPKLMERVLENVRKISAHERKDGNSPPDASEAGHG